MGCGMSTEEKEGKQRNEEIENQLKRDRMMQRNEIKMLLLGTWSTCRGWIRTDVSQVLESLANQPSSSR